MGCFSLLETEDPRVHFSGPQALVAKNGKGLMMFSCRADGCHKCSLHPISAPQGLSVPTLQGKPATPRKMHLEPCPEGGRKRWIPRCCYTNVPQASLLRVTTAPPSLSLFSSELVAKSSSLPPQVPSPSAPPYPRLQHSHLL